MREAEDPKVVQAEAQDKSKVQTKGDPAKNPEPAVKEAQDPSGSDSSKPHLPLEPKAPVQEESVGMEAPEAPAEPLDAEAGIALEDTEFLYGPDPGQAEHDTDMQQEIEFGGAMHVAYLMSALLTAACRKVRC